MEGGTRRSKRTGGEEDGKPPAEKVAVPAAAMVVVVVVGEVEEGAVGRENRRWVDRCMNIHDLTTNPYTATGLCLHYCISNSADGSQNSVLADPRGHPRIHVAR